MFRFETMTHEWTAVRTARPSRNYDQVVAFYRDHVGLELIASFVDHSSYDGTIFSLGAKALQLEITHHESGQPIPHPSEEDLLVLYFEDAITRDVVASRLRSGGHQAVALANPFWGADSLGYRDPDGWTLVLTLRGA